MDPRLTLKRSNRLNTGRTAPLLSATRITLKQMRQPVVHQLNDTAELQALRAENAKLRKQVAEAVERAQREDRVINAPGFTERDGREAFRARLGLAPHVVKVAITGSTVRVQDTLGRGR